MNQYFDNTYKTEPCPYCETPCLADWVDCGFGPCVQCGPYHCENCGASEIGPERGRGEVTLNEEEERTGWYRSKISPYANTYQGKLVDHKLALALYRKGLLDEKL